MSFVEESNWRIFCNLSIAKPHQLLMEEKPPINVVCTPQIGNIIFIRSIIFKNLFKCLKVSITCIYTCNFLKSIYDMIHIVLNLFQKWLFLFQWLRRLDTCLCLSRRCWFGFILLRSFINLPKVISISLEKFRSFIIPVINALI